MHTIIRNPSLFRRVWAKSRQQLFILALLALACRAFAGGLVFPDGLVAHWAFDEMSGLQVRDSSTNHLDGLLSGGTWCTGETVLDGGVQFQSAGALFIPSYGLGAPEQIAGLPYGSLAIRFRFAVSSSGAVIPIFYMGQRTAELPEQFTLIVEIGHGGDPANRRLYFTIINSGFCFDTGANLEPNTWYQFVGVVGGSGNTGYLNGQELVGRHYNLGSTPAYTNFFSSVRSRECLSVGCGRYGGEFLYGSCTVSDVQIYNRPLTGEEVRRLYRDTIDPQLLQITGPTLTPQGDGMLLSWPADPNYIYSVMATDGLSGEWLEFFDFERLYDATPMTTILIPLEQTPMRLFRVMAAPRLPESF